MLKLGAAEEWIFTMVPLPVSLDFVYEGWNGYRDSIVRAVAPLTPEQLAWRPAAHLRSVGELVRHIVLGPIDWFLRMEAPGSRELVSRIDSWDRDPHGTLLLSSFWSHAEEEITT
jgi:hypothetical protein